ncbi:hypothetical protein LCGC14_1238740 [marine sediment metagenome]|uniref:Uncharacterized protein n=1 Tax=marine sediment metagenome TaxID=412755 RepID=A0A0F9PAM8_9ZZZZ
MALRDIDLKGLSRVELQQVLNKLPKKERDKYEVDDTHDLIKKKGWRVTTMEQLGKDTVAAHIAAEEADVRNRIDRT